MSAVSRYVDAFVRHPARRLRRRRRRGLVLQAAWAICACVSACVSASGWAAELDRERTIALAASVVKIEAIKQSGGYSLGTAVAVAPGRFITNCHVTREALQVMVVRSGARWRAASERADLFYDLCMLLVPGLDDVPPVPLASARELRPEEPVAAAGYTGGAGLQLHAGVVRAVHELNGSKVIQTTTAFTSGASGGALFNADGKLVGILTFRLRGAADYYFAAPVDWVADRIADHSGFVPVAPLSGPAPFWAQPAASLPFFMQAASFERDARWSDLLGLTDRWTREDSGNAESWFMRGVSLARLGQPDRAADAYRKSVELNPRFTRAWFDLGNAYVELGRFDGAREVYGVLVELDAPLAAQLAASLEAALR